MMKVSVHDDASAAAKQEIAALKTRLAEAAETNAALDREKTALEERASSPGRLAPPPSAGKCRSG